MVSERLLLTVISGMVIESSLKLFYHLLRVQLEGPKGEDGHGSMRMVCD
jgi:hypothetical protein